ncbi:high mobility group box domain-containing protein [Mucor mucedo]|uniref:high mobility group box domain-containing protein n=1 Tax=Mucor mucedo TaxID=29922 RepID=UPI002221187C|nr:high mobility group box domain-containing protein [Mucor mucedo]KAI7890706.1 high mobility group box domain-containing protein [Mucor mucedo]
MSREERITQAHEIIQTITRGLSDLAELLIFEKNTDANAHDNKKKRRDPNAPKPPTSNFFLFTNSIRDAVDKEFPDATFAEKSKIYGARWQLLSEEERKPFTEKANEERDRYKELMATYEAERGENHVEKKAKKETPVKASIAAPSTSKTVTKETSSKTKEVPTKAKEVPTKAKEAPAKATKAAKAAPTKTTKTVTEKVSKSTEKPVETAKSTKAATKAAKAAAKATPAKPVTPAKAAPKAAPKPVESSSSESDSDDSSSSSDSDSD